MTSSVDAARALTTSRAQPWPSGQVGRVALTPADPVVAGGFATWTVRYEVGPYGMDDGGGLKLLFPIPSDRGVPQFTRPSGPDYTTVRTSGTARVRARYATKLHTRPWVKGIAVDVEDGPLAPGDIIEVVIGDTGQGSPGAAVQSYREPAATIRVMVDPFATNVYYDVPGSTGHPVVAGPATALVAIAPSQARQGESAAVSVRAIDRYGNVAAQVSGALTVRAGGAVVATGTLVDGMTRVEVPISASGVLRLRVDHPGSGLTTETNPLVVGREMPLRWGDTQGQTGETVGSGSLDDFFHYAKDAAALDFVTHSANDFQVEDAFYAEVLRTTDRFTAAGTFVAFAGFEWSGNTPVGGDHNVLYADNQHAPLLRSSRALVQDSPEDGTDRRTIGDVAKTLRRDGIHAICVAHVGGRVADLAQIDPAVTPVLEIVSVHGWFEWFALDALRLGHRVGFVGASDDHSGRPGASFPSLPLFGVRSGLAAVRGGDLTRTGILRALEQRHCYATTGERIVLDVRHGGHRMGDAWDAPSDQPPRFDVTVHGTSGIERIDLMDAGGVVDTWRPGPGIRGGRLRVSWRGARSRYRNRVQNWDGTLHVRGARITSATEWAFDHPDHGIVKQDNETVSWRSSTNGDHDGLILTFDEVPEDIRLHAGDVDLTVPMAELGPDPVEYALDGGVDRAVEVCWLPEPSSPADVETALTPSRHRAGGNAWLVRVTQEDGHRAWSSPLFVDLRSADGSSR
ncbi:hypothetical protein [Amycolatopsis jejuensis]|uniref:hypothetical protein n=1 Tax=Amycolatopsis jejuensis TaxID=330084 RepID=UPI00052678E5|nr:hypothetical protein [Amycolatopsis jejuensis]